jgi:hypothetical protein
MAGKLVDKLPATAGFVTGRADAWPLRLLNHPRPYLVTISDESLAA